MAAQAVYLGSSGIKIGLVHKHVDSSIIQTGDTDHEYRKRRAPLTRREWTITWVGTATPSAVERNFEVFGTHTSWLLQPPREDDYIETAQACKNTVTGLTVGDGSTATFQLQITRTLGTISGSKNILHPRTSTVVVRVNAVTKVETTDYTINYSTGIITFGGGDIPANGHPVVADFHYDTPVRWRSEELETSIIQAFGDDPQQEVTSASAIEVFDE